MMASTERTGTHSRREGELKTKAPSIEGPSPSCRNRCHQDTETRRYGISFREICLLTGKRMQKQQPSESLLDVTEGRLTTRGVLHLGYKPPWAFTCGMSWWERSHMDILPEYSL